MKKLLLISIMLCSIISISCDKLAKPDMEGYADSCKVFLNCMYLNQKNPDKTICLGLADGCKQANDFILCANSDKVDFKDCLLLLKK